MEIVVSCCEVEGMHANDDDDSAITRAHGTSNCERAQSPVCAVSKVRIE
jgi:hypothetical protein